LPWPAQDTWEAKYGMAIPLVCKPQRVKEKGKAIPERKVNRKAIIE
jgi:hypothetical protein